MIKSKDYNKELDKIEGELKNANTTELEVLKALTKGIVLVAKALRDVKQNQVRIMKDVYKLSFDVPQEEKKETPSA